MNELKEYIEFMVTLYKPFLPPKYYNNMEQKLWDIVEQAMTVQQQICGGHKNG